MKKKYIMGIAVLVALLCLGLVMCSMFDGSDNDYYEGETVPIEIGEDIFNDEQEDSTSGSDTSGSDNGESNADKSNGAENAADGNSADERDKTGSSDGTSDTKDEEDGGNADLDKGWSPFY